MRPLLRNLLAFALSWVAAEALEAAIQTGPGRALARAAGRPDIAEPAGARNLGKYLRTATGMLFAAMLAARGREPEEPIAEDSLSSRLGWFADGLAAASTLVRLIADSLRKV